MKLRIAIILLSGILLTACGKNDAKIKDLRKAAIIFMEEGDYSSAIENLDEALSLRGSEKLDSLSVDILEYRAQAEYQLADYQAAEFTYEILYNHNDKAEYLTMMIISKSKLGVDISDIFTLYDKLIEKKDRGVIFDNTLYEMSNRALDEYSKNNDEKIIEKLLSYCFEANEYLKDNKAKLYTLISNIYYYSKDYNKALEYIEISRQNLKPEDDIELEMINLSNEAGCYEYLGDFKKAYELFNSYIELYGENEDIRHEIKFLETRINK